jgi:hypothetical protein
MSELKIVADRLKQVLYNLKNAKLISSQQELGEMLGFNNKSHVSQIFNGQCNSEMFIYKLGEKFPHINIDWIKTGKGRLMKEECYANRDKLMNSYFETSLDSCDDIFSSHDACPETPSENVEIQTEEVTLASIPIVPPAIIDQPDVIIEQDIELNSSEYEKLNLERIIRMVDIAYRVQTEKLAPYVNIGDILLLKKLKGEDEVRNSELHLIKTKHQGSYLRYTFDEGDKYRLAATNRAPECFIPKNKVTEIFMYICNISFSVAMPDYLTNKQLRQQGKQITSLVDSVNNLVTATIDEGRRTDVVLSMLKDELNKNK